LRRTSFRDVARLLYYRPTTKPAKLITIII
jgi:hypothetical protein